MGNNNFVKLWMDYCTEDLHPQNQSRAFKNNEKDGKLFMNSMG